MEQRSRSGLYRSGQRRAKQAARQAAQNGQNGQNGAQGGVDEGARQDPRKGMETIPHVGRPLDGSQFGDVIEEQAWADKRPSPEEQKRRTTPLNDKTR